MREGQSKTSEIQLTHARTGHLLTNSGIWSRDGQWIVYDIRSDPAGSQFDGSRIERVNVATGEIQVLYESAHRAFCGVPTFSPVDDKVIFILGPENPTADWQYAANHRDGMIGDVAQPMIVRHMDARDVVAPFTAGALRGGSHVHTFSGDGRWVSFTYEDAVLDRFDRETADHEMNLRCVGVAAPGNVKVGGGSPWNHDGDFFSVVAAKLHGNPEPGSDQINRAFEDAWVGTDGYLRPDGTRRRRAIAFQGQVLTSDQQVMSEVFIVDLPDDLTIAGDGPLQGTATLRPRPPRGVVQRRLTYTLRRKYPGLQGPRHWLRSSPDGSSIAFLMKDDAAVVQIFAVSTNGGEPRQITRNQWSIASAFTWNSDGKYLAYVMDNSVFTTCVATGFSTRLTPRSSDPESPRAEACVFSPDRNRIAFIRNITAGNERFNQICVVQTGMCI